ncbi:maleylpyruvate isomerase N-terminal domain-containing protein [Mycobacterium sp. M1]|uniref:Maleylpyruvate isomerase N-terminal domain-containing protein n=1 Tax=Mycolicibacter acidiphilus TaxID=2835306 RepID=A0ABS5RKX7_9MYCO|nr:maleylpyruvate isomerase N-terminal domain-containing protein [Mycolicibacter acidiphilus]MBS9534920.1 maleylpyruvate isomerase N-terminal domain-containing protein [Mycolicibacter acidiphilus]
MPSDQQPSGVPAEESTRAPRPAPVADAAAAYRLVHERLVALLGGRDDVGEFAVPACPGWTVRQTVAHLVGVGQDVVAMNMADKAGDSWVQAQLDRLGGFGIDRLLDLWGQLIDPVTARLALEVAAGQLVFDTLTHEHDIRGALGEPGSRTGDLTFEVALGFLTTMGDLMIRQGSLPALRLTTPAIGTVHLGDPDSAKEPAALDISDFEAVRALGGRRSVRQLSALPWDRDPTDWMPVFTHWLPVFSNGGIRPPSDDLVE